MCGTRFTPLTFVDAETLLQMTAAAVPDLGLSFLGALGDVSTDGMFIGLFYYYSDYFMTIVYRPVWPVEICGLGTVVLLIPLNSALAGRGTRIVRYCNE